MTDTIAGFSGRVITRQDREHPAARTIWNQAHDHQAAVIAQCRGTGDVAAALRHARERGPARRGPRGVKRAYDPDTVFGSVPYPLS